MVENAAVDFKVENAAVAEVAVAVVEVAETEIGVALTKGL